MNYVISTNDYRATGNLCSCVRSYHCVGLHPNENYQMSRLTSINYEEMEVRLARAQTEIRDLESHNKKLTEQIKQIEEANKILKSHAERLQAEVDSQTVRVFDNSGRQLTEAQKQFRKDLGRAVAFYFNMIVAKNDQYGDSALSPLHVFADKGISARQLIRVRMDDKIKRLMNINSLPDSEDPVQDFVGYGLLDWIAAYREKQNNEIRPEEKTP